MRRRHHTWPLEEVWHLNNKVKILLQFLINYSTPQVVLRSTLQVRRGVRRRERVMLAHTLVNLAILKVRGHVVENGTWLAVGRHGSAVQAVEIGVYGLVVEKGRSEYARSWCQQLPCHGHVVENGT